MLNKYSLNLFIILLTLASCTKKIDRINLKQNMENIKNIPQPKWDNLVRQKIYFGHQSVGYNMIDGIEAILNENPNIKLNIKKGKNIDLFNIPIFAHDNNGSNRDTKAKIDDFCNTLKNGLGNTVDIAGFKFCYVDIENDSDIKGIFDYYKMKMNEISLKFPKVKIIHFTVPIKSLQAGPKGFIKKLLGKDIGIKDNMARLYFNELLVNEYKDHFIFDLAEAESTYSDGSREYSEVDGKTIFTMIPAYTNDGGHLSKKGKLIIGSDLLIFLTNLPNGRNN